MACTWHASPLSSLTSQPNVRLRSPRNGVGFLADLPRCVTYQAESRGVCTAVLFHPTTRQLSSYFSTRVRTRTPEYSNVTSPRIATESPAAPPRAGGGTHSGIGQQPPPQTSETPPPPPPCGAGRLGRSGIEHLQLHRRRKPRTRSIIRNLAYGSSTAGKGCKPLAGSTYYVVPCTVPCTSGSEIVRSASGRRLGILRSSQ